MEDETQLEILQDSLFKHCSEGDTGTIFISTLNNKSCQIVLANGEIKTASLARFKGIEAILEMKEVGIKAATYTDRMQFKHSDDAIIDSSDVVLNMLGYVKLEDQPEEQPEEQETEKSTRMYRGQIIEEPMEPKKTKDSNKAPRMYRGQIIDD